MKLKIKSKKIKKALIVIAIIIVFVAGLLIGRLTSGTTIGITDTNSETTTQIVEVEVGTQTIENTLTSAGEILSSGTENLELDTDKYFSTMCVESDDIVAEGENILEYTDGTYLTAEYDCLISSYSVPETEEICTSSDYIRVENLANMQLQLSISEDEINTISVGQEVTVEVNAIEDTTYTGSIVSVSSVGTYSSSGTTFTAIAEFENDENIKPGMSASCTIVLEKAEDCIAVPIEAVQTSNNEKYVIVVNADGTTENVTIETGISNDSYVQVTSGLEGGETIQMVQTVSSNSSTNSKGMSGGRGEMSDEMPMGMSGDKSNMDFSGGEMPGGDMQRGN